MNKLDDIQKNQLDIRERLAKVETMIHERTDDTKEIRNMLKSHEDRLAELEAHKQSNIGAREIVAFLVMAGLALWGVLK
jgi:chromosome segregation ATPase